jgi:hypothetical protein
MCNSLNTVAYIIEKIGELHLVPKADDRRELVCIVQTQAKSPSIPLLQKREVGSLSSPVNLFIQKNSLSKPPGNLSLCKGRLRGIW